jgi:protocatechuate 3,4-dioxygenase beta subunit
MKANRRDFLRLTSLLGAASIIPNNRIFTGTVKAVGPTDCVLIPSETAGPFPLDLTENTFYFRQDIREDRTGVQLNMKMKIMGIENCGPMQNVRVNVWHCDKDGLYSGYDTIGNPGQQGLTYLRGYQMTDAFGDVEFITILPGWYPGRVCHIHFQVYVSSAYAAISQLTFDVEAKNDIYLAYPELYTKGIDPVLPENDNVFADGYEYQLSPLTPNSGTGGYDGYLEVNVQGSGTLGIGHIEKETAKQFVLGQNHPNPYQSETTIPFVLKNTSNVKLELWDISGKKQAVLNRGELFPGEHKILVNLFETGLSQGNYIYQLEVRNSAGIFRQCMMMTSEK